MFCDECGGVVDVVVVIVDVVIVEVWYVVILDILELLMMECGGECGVC